MPDLRTEVRNWIQAHWSLDITVREWWRRLAAARLTRPSWPEPYGRGLRAADERAVSEELGLAGVVGPPQGAVGSSLAGPTILAHGSPLQQRRYLPPLLEGTESWCQLFSEPGAGSDLPALSTRAVRDGHTWLIDGQKVWTSSADIARRGLLLARTDPDRPKRDGVTYFVIDMDQPGVQTRPLRQMNGEAHFCEVFLTAARVRDDDIVGEVHAGWRAARTTMGFERAMVTARPARGMVSVPSGEKAGYLDRLTGDVVSQSRGVQAPAFSGNAVPSRRMLALAREREVEHDPTIRQQLARYYTLTEISRFTQLRVASAARAGQPVGPEASIAKLAISNICQLSRDLSLALLGAHGTLSGADAPYAGTVQSVALASSGTRIGGGTDEIQKNSLGERALGLPREPSIDDGVPWRQLRR